LVGNLQTDNFPAYFSGVIWLCCWRLELDINHNHARLASFIFIVCDTNLSYNEPVWFPFLNYDYFFKKISENHRLFCHA
jgi:hypothetical protein